MSEQDEVNEIGDEIVDVARLKIKQDGWEGAIETAVFMISDSFKKLTDLLDMDDYDDETMELFTQQGMMVAMLLALMAERRNVDLTKGRQPPRRSN